MSYFSAHRAITQEMMDYCRICDDRLSRDIEMISRVLYQKDTQIFKLEAHAERQTQLIADLHRWQDDGGS